MLNSLRSAKVCGIYLVLGCGALWAQNLAQPPDYSDPAVASAAQETTKSWQAWQRGDRDLERNVFEGPMADARDRIQRSFSAMLGYLEKRKAYSESVAAYIEHYKSDTPVRKPFVTIETVNREQLELLGANLTNVQSRLDGLRDSPAWVRIRRSVQADSSEITSVQSARRSELPIDLPLSRPEPPRQMSAIVYRDSERQITELLSKLWTHYYQALDDAVEQKPGGAQPLVSSSSVAPHEALAPAPEGFSGGAGPRSAGLPGLEALAGTWRYAERSQQFNGVEEPRQVLLEISVEKGGTLSGRYRAILTDFDGPHNVDIALHQVPGGKNPKELRFRYKGDQDVEGEFTVEGPGASGIDLIVAHNGGAGVPKGREIVTRR
jgi:hypothetical protein